jgi:hypothetical protein
MTLKLMKLRSAVGVCFAFVLCSSLEADWKVKKTTQISMGFFATTGVVFYDITTSEVGIQASACAGVSVGSEVMGVGAVEKAQFCFDWEVKSKTKTRLSSRKEQMKALSDAMNSKGLKAEFIDAMKKQLKSASDAELESIGLKRKHIDDIKDVKFAPAEDKTEDKAKVLQILKNCPTIPSGPQTNS